MAQFELHYGGQVYEIVSEEVANLAVKAIGEAAVAKKFGMMSVECRTGSVHVLLGSSIPIAVRNTTPVEDGEDSAMFL